jgi:hypothetical protein
MSSSGDIPTAIPYVRFAHSCFHTTQRKHRLAPVIPKHRNIAHSHGGEVTLQNLREGGLRVTLVLPRG